MDRRREPRFTSNRPVAVRLLGDNPLTLTGTISNVSGRGMRILLDRKVPVDTAMRIDVDGSIVLAEVCYSEPDNGAYATGLVLDQVLVETPGLWSLHHALRTSHEPVEKGATRETSG